MSDNTTCPSCKNYFLVKRNLKYSVRATPYFLGLALENMVLPWRKGFEEIYDAHLVVCPSCGNEFTVSNYRYFGFITVGQLRIGLIFFFLFFIFAPIAVMVWNIVT